MSLTSWHRAGKQTHGETYDPLHTYPLSTNLFLFVAINTLDLVVAYDKILCNPFYNPIPPFYCILSSILDLIQNSISIITCLSLSSYHTSTSTTLYLSISTPLSNMYMFDVAPPYRTQADMDMMHHHQYRCIIFDIPLIHCLLEDIKLY